MQVLICHLSDIHFSVSKESNIIYNRLEKIKEAILSNFGQDDHMFIVITGDVAFSGKAEEYKVAQEFLEELYVSINSDNVRFVIVPGNHDCNFNLEDGTRISLIKDILSSKGKEIDQSIINNCTEVQKYFYEFSQSMSAISWVEDSNKIHLSQEFKLGDEFTILFNMINSSWMSQKKEKQSQIIMPLEFINEIKLKNYDLIISLFHHPYNWLDADNCRLFRDKIEKFSDIIITGHEHLSSKQSVNTMNIYTNEFYMGSILQDKEKNDISGFNIIIFNLEDEHYKFKNYEWNSNIYSVSNETTWKEFRRNKLIEKQKFMLNELFLNELNDTGAQFYHPHKDKLLLEDIFIYPDLRIISHDDSSKEHILFKSRDIISNSNDKYLIITGEEKSGKTTLAKKIYMDLYSEKTIPIMIDGKHINTPREEDLLNIIQRAFDNQYCQELYEEYTQIDNNKKFLIIDNFENVKMNAKGKAAIINLVMKKYNNVIMFADSSFRVEQLINQESLNSLALEIKNYDLVNFGHYLRSELIKKWYSIGREFIITDDELEYKSIEIEKTVNQLLGRNLLPSYPIFILIILQQLETNKKNIQSLSSYGYLYGSLITDSLLNINSSPDLIDTLYTYMSVMAYYLYENNREYLDENDIHEVTKIYNEKFTMSLSEWKVINNLIKAGIMECSNDCEYYFKYKYIYYYFIAKYLSDNIEQLEIKFNIGNICNNLHSEQNSNIMMFLCHLSKSTFIINELINKSKQLFKDYMAYDFDNHVPFINRMYKKIPNLSLTDVEPSQNRKGVLKQKDEIERTIEEQDEEQFYDDADNEVEDILLINKAFKTIEILGQIIKNYPGSIQGVIKFDAALECYMLGMRTLSMFLNKIDENIEDILEILLDTIKEKEGNNKKITEEKCKLFVMTLTEYISLGIIKKISESVGNKKLLGTYEEIFKKYSNTSIGLVDLAVKLECMTSFPKKETFIMADKLDKNLFSLSILKRLVTGHLYVHPCDYSTKQKICDKLNISYKKVTLVEGKTINRK
ncbi:MAG: hypothetical protein FH758_04105 [Firmicutes bacterium]|nr:hypothetical protein [Bacillota bacterium]